MIARRVFVALSLLLLATLLAQASRETRPRYKSPLGLSVDATGQFAYVALHGAGALAIVDLCGGEVVCEIPVGRKPYDVALHKGVAYVTCEADDTVVAVDVEARKVKRTFKVGQAPRGVSVDPRTGLIQVVCHDDRALWTQVAPVANAPGSPFVALDSPRAFKQEPIPPQPEGNFARAGNLELVLANQSAYRQTPRPHNLFTQGQAISDPKSAAASAKNPAPLTPPRPPLIRADLKGAPQRTAFNPTLDLDYSRTSMDLVAHTRPRWFTPTVKAAEGRVFTNAFSFFLNSTTSAAIVLLDEPDKGYPDPTDVVVQLPKAARERQRPEGNLPPLTQTGGADAHPLKGARVFISSGGADTVLVLDLHKAGKHFEANRGMGMPGMQMGGMGMSGGWGGGMHSMGMGMPGMQMGGMGMPGPGLGLPGSGGIAKPGSSGPPRSPGRAGVSPGGGTVMPGGSFTPPGNFPMGMGWHGGMGMAGMGMPGMSMPVFREDLRASANYTIARLKTQANPRRMVLTPDGGTLIVSNHLADSLTLIDADTLTVIGHIDLGGPEPDVARQGEILFHSAKLTFQQQFTCASCHPGNGSDGLAWNTSPDGAGEPLNTRALHGVRDTGPFGWQGESDSFEERARNTMREVHKHKISDADASAIAAFMKTLDPPRPLPQKTKDAPAMARGEKLFFGKANCNRCHRGPAYTSSYPRAVIQDQKQQWTPYDVPSLRGVARTAPYLHDGRAATLEEIFEKHNPNKRHGLAHELTPPERGDLIAFLRSL